MYRLIDRKAGVNGFLGVGGLSKNGHLRPRLPAPAKTMLLDSRYLLITVDSLR